jgi:predicted transcriptional regulator
MEVPQMVKKSAVGSVAKRNVAITALQSNVIPTECLILFLDTYNSIRAKEFRKYFDVVKPGVIFKVLISLYVKPSQSKTALQLKARVNGDTIANSIEYLLSQGYIKKVNKPRLIIPFQAYKIDVGYRITGKGEQIIYSIFNSLLD